MRRKYIIIIGSIVISILWYSSILLTQNQRKDNNSNHMTLEITPQHSSYRLILVTTGDYQEENLVFTSDIRSYNIDHNELRHVNSTLSYDISNHHINRLIINTISGSDHLSSASLIFINDIIIPQIGNNLILSWTILNNLSMKQSDSLFTTSYIWTATWQDSLWTRQHITIWIQQYCSPLYYIWRKEYCSIQWNINITTPLTSGPIWAKIQGQFSTSHLQ